jgi:hypothetical protein
MRYRLIILLLAPLVIGLVPQVKPIAIIGGIIAILAPQSIIEILKFIYGTRLMPEAIVTARGSQAIVRIGVGTGDSTKPTHDSASRFTGRMLSRHSTG